jgi:hypothetical protein
MRNEKKPFYVPALRMKKGELQGVLGLAEDVKAPTLPHWIVPPRIERDDEVQQALIATESVPGAGIVLSQYWADRPALLDLRYLFEEFGEAESSLWLPRAHELARTARVPVIPVAGLSDLSGPRAAGFRDSVAAGGLRLGLRIDSSELIEAGLKERLQRAIERVGVAPEATAVLVEFSDTDFSDTDLVAGVFENVIEGLEEAGRWFGIVCQATSYPESNPAGPSGEVVIPRTEWKAWTRAVGFSRDTGDHLLFGDYAADCARMLFGKSSARAIRHYRYATLEDWFVVRGAETGDDQTLMRDVCRRIVRGGYFAGRGFSSADEFIYRCAEAGGGPGNSTTWREINTTHHITRVVRDMGGVKGVLFSDRKVAPPARQIDMFPAETS